MQYLYIARMLRHSLIDVFKKFIHFEKTLTKIYHNNLFNIVFFFLLYQIMRKSENQDVIHWPLVKI